MSVIKETMFEVVPPEGLDEQAVQIIQSLGIKWLMGELESGAELSLMALGGNSFAQDIVCYIDSHRELFLEHFLTT